jgi:hypothetical protein
MPPARLVDAQNARIWTASVVIGIDRRGGPPRSAQTCTGGVRVELGAARRSEAAARAAELGVLDAQDR